MDEFIKFIGIILQILDVIKGCAFDIVLPNVIRLAHVSFFQFLILFVVSLAIIEQFAKYVARRIRRMIGF